MQEIQEKILSIPDLPQNKLKKTLILDLDETLIHSVFLQQQE